MIKTKDYLAYTKLPEDSSQEVIIGTLLGLSPIEVRDLSIAKIGQAMIDAQEATKESNIPAFSLPIEYGKLTYGKWMDIEHFAGAGKMLHEIAVVIAEKDYNIESIEAKAEELANMPAKNMIPVVIQHLKKKRLRSVSIRDYTLQIRQYQEAAIKIIKTRLALGRLGDPTPLLSIYLRASLILIRLLKLLRTMSSHFSRIKNSFSTHKPSIERPKH